MGNIEYYIDITLLFTTTVYMFMLGQYILFKNRYSRNNQGFAFLLGGLFLWNAATLIKVINQDPGLQLFIVRALYAVSPITFAGVFTFILIFPEGKKLSIWAKTALILITVFFMTATVFFPASMVKDIVITNPSLLYTAKVIGGPLFLSFNLYMMFIIIATVLLSAIKYFLSKGKERRTMRIITFGFVVAGFADIFFQLLPRLFGFSVMASIFPVSVIIALTTTAYAVVYLKAFSITPAVAQEEMLNALSNSILLTDLEGIFLLKNDLAKDTDPAVIKKIIDAVIRNGNLLDYYIEIGKNKFTASANFIKEGNAILILLHNITHIESNLEKEKEDKAIISAKLKKQEALKGIVFDIASLNSADDIKLATENAIKTFHDDPTSSAIISNLGRKSLARINYTKELEQKRLVLEKKALEESSNNNEIMQKELEKNELVEKIRGMGK
ncbi:MAG: histidine kinase N-terminal 7TM domain-containing protein [Candidatus Margulisiibacteriota bacterium]